MFTASLKNLGDRAGALFEKKKKNAVDIATEKAENAKKLAEDQVKKTSDAIQNASSGASGLVGGIADGVKSDSKDAAKAGGEQSQHQI